jgi:carboxymethylenebutenolidase
LIELDTGAGQARAYKGKPERASGPGVLVLHAWWGLTPFFKGVCDRLAAEGFVSLAPDLFGGVTADTAEEAEQLVNGMDNKRTYQLITAAVERLRLESGSDGVGVVGFSLGGYWALALEDHIRAVVTFYGTGDPEQVTSDAAYQGHFAETDEFAPMEEVRRLEDGLRAKGKEVEFHVYEGAGHWFFEEDRPGHYDPEAARLAWARTVQFLRRHLG